MLRGATNIIWHNHKRGKARVVLVAMYGWKVISNKQVLNFFTKDFIVIGSWFQIVKADTEKARLLILSLVLGT